jgi:hypothetical protein
MRLENDAIAIDFDPQTGGFAGLTDKQSGHNFIGAPDRALLFRAIVPQGALLADPVESTGASITVEGNTATIRYTLAGLEATATLVLEDGAAFEARLELRNTGTTPIEEIMFPYVRGLAPLPEACVVWPYSFFRKIDDLFGKGLGGDHITWNEWTQKNVARYPAHLASAWADYGNTQHGIGIEGRHTDFSIIDFFVHKIIDKTQERTSRSLDLVTVHPRRIAPGETWQSPPVRINLHIGDWHATAGAHRKWLETWVTKPDRPKKFADAIGWHFFFMKHQDGVVCYDYEGLPDMAEAAMAAGCPYLLVFGWQEGGHDNNYMYRYIVNEEWGGAAKLRDKLKQCKALGVEVMPFYNGTLANIEMPEHKEFGYKWEAKTRAGHPYYAGDWARHNFDAMTRNRAMLHHEMAPCEGHRKYYLETVKRMLTEYGFQNMQLDQGSEKMLVDYAEDHATTTPDRVYVDGLRELMPKVREMVKQANPDGVIISEFFNDFTGQWCDSSWDWTMLLPFPEPILYTIPWVFGSHEIDANEYDQVNIAFAYKLHLDMKIDGGDAPITKYPRFADHVRRNAELRRRVSEYYSTADFRDQDGVRMEGEGVLAKVFLNKQTRKGSIVLAETKGAEATVTLDSAWKPVSGAFSSDSNCGTPEQVRWEKELQITLDPYEVRVLCMDLA